MNDEHHVHNNEGLHVHNNGEQHVHNNGELHVDNHTGDPAIFSKTYQYDFPEKVSGKRLQQAYCLWIEEIKDWAKQNGYFIGHIKIFVESRENIWLSSTGRSISVKQSSGWNELLTESISVNVTAIVFDPSRDTLEKISEQRLKVRRDLIA